MEFRSTGDRKPRANPVIHEQYTTNFMDFPVEIHQHIIAEFLKDLDTNFHEFKALRLVCRRFNAIVKPRVYSSHIKLFDDEHLSSNMDQLLTLLSSKPNEQFHATTTLFIGNSDWLDGKGVSIPFRAISPNRGLFPKGWSRLPCAHLQNSGFTSPFPSSTCRMSLALYGIQGLILQSG
ncbi:hypothetical protein F5887DRAFT_1013101 [Amanita rubescens]|nr:hypothetical protein F5887DRAFT_1013101 [Amanita rubescens]